MSKIVLLTFLFLLFSCSFTHTNSSVQRSKKKISIPEWVNSPSKYCGNRKLCAVGEGSRRFMAEGGAVDSIAKIFKTLVKSKMTTTTDMDTDRTQTFQTEDFSSSIELTTKEVLKGVIVEETWEDAKEGTWFALASLDKRAASKRFKNEMSAIDDKIKELYRLQTRVGLNKALRILDTRDQINDRFETVSGSRYKVPVSRSMIIRKKHDKAKLGVKLFVNFESKIFVKELKDIMNSLMLENDYQITKSKSDANFIVSGKLSSQKEHMNAQGFVKYKFRLELRSSSPSGTKLGGLSFKVTKAGRSLRNCYQKSLPEIKSFIKDNLDQLKID